MCFLKSEVVINIFNLQLHLRINQKRTQTKSVAQKSVLSSLVYIIMCFIPMSFSCHNTEPIKASNPHPNQ